MFQPGCLGQIVTERDQSTSGGFDFVPNEFLVSDRNISSIEPKLYQERFIHFIKNRVFSKNTTNNNNNNNSNSNYNNNGSGSRNGYNVDHGRTESNSSVRSSNSGSRRNSSNGLVNGIPVAPLAPFAPSTHVSSSSSSIPLAVAPVVQQQRMRMYRVVVPNGVVAGSEFTVNAGGRNYSILCPRNGGPGSMVEVQLPA